MKFFISLILVFCLLSQVHATNLRGQVIRYDQGSGRTFPLANVRVDLWIFNGQSWIDLSYAITGQDGFYFFINVTPGYYFRMQVFGNLFPGQGYYTVMNVFPPNFQNVQQISS
jgi:hypothetical protein